MAAEEEGPADREGGAGARPARGARLFERLGRGIVRHPWYPIIFWVLLLVVALPATMNVNSVTTNSATTLPNSAPSVVAQNEINQLFPNQSSGSSTFLLLIGQNIVGAAGQRTVLNITQAIQTSSSIRYLGSVDTLYTAYQSYLQGQAELGLGVLSSALNATPSLPVAVNLTAQFVWGPATLYTQVWTQLVSANPALPPAAENWPSFNQTRTLLAPNRVAVTVLGDFYNGSSGVLGFNQSVRLPANSSCLSSQNIAPCADLTMRAVFPVVLPGLVPQPANQSLPLYLLSMLDVENNTGAGAGPQRNATTNFLSMESGLPGRWLSLLWATFPLGTASPTAVQEWTSGIVTGNPLAQYPLPIPAGIYRSFVNPAANATLIIVTFTESDSYTAPNGSTPVFDDINRLNTLVPSVIQWSAPASGFAFVQTGASALNQNENHILSADLQFILPITVVVLVLITMLYFRAPGAPVLTFGAIGIALALGLGAIYLLGKYVTQFDVTSLTLVNTFVLGVGTDYSVFLAARYREELVRGVEPAKAVVTTVTWAGESIATSGLTVIVATLAMAFSGVTLLSQWGIALSVAVALTLLLALTVTPALLVLIGPRIFWPYTGARFHRFAERSRSRIADGSTYFARAGRMSTRHPKAVLGIIVLVSVPLIYVALNVPLSYNFYAQLPANQPAAIGLQQLSHQFGAGYAFPTIILVGFQRPLLAANVTDGPEFTEINAIAATMMRTSGIATVDSPVGSAGAPLATWLNFSSLPPAQQVNLRGALDNYLGSDHRTVWFTVTPTSDGLSNAAVASLNQMQNRLTTYVGNHTDVRSIAYGGAASTVRDLRAQTDLATERMAIAATIGLFVVLFLVLGSALVPPMALATIGVSIGWAWALTYLLLGQLQGLALFFYVPVILFVLILGLGMDYNVFLLTRVREERLKDGSPTRSVTRAVTHTGGVITAAAVILASAFLVLGTSSFTLLRAIGLAVGLAVLLDAMVVRTYLVPAALALGRERIWWGPKRLRRVRVGTQPADGGDGLPPIGP